jgi:uncharacterized protein (TIGR01319 family)
MAQHGFLITDCGSTTTKAILVEEREGGFRLSARGEAPTTVEAPHEDVTRGVLGAVGEIEELTGRTFLEKERITGVEGYLSTSSAGGGLQMAVAGVVRSMTSRSAARAALGAGAIVMDSFSANDGRPAHLKIARIRAMRPDMILLAGGVDGGTVTHVLEMAELIKAAQPRPRLGTGFKLPVIYGGNRDAARQVMEILGGETDLDVVANLRPELERENLSPAREKIHDLFMEHVMAQAPGYGRLMSWTDAPIVPTPGAVGSLIQRVADEEGISVMGVDIGGATTDLFSVFEGTFTRTVSANLGMSYSVSNVLAEAGYEGIARWLPFSVGEEALRDRIGNKMIRPTTIPQTLEDLKVEQAIAREALRLSLVQHREFAVQLEGVQAERTMSDFFTSREKGKSLVDMMALDLLIGSGGVLSHAPRRAQAARMLIDAFEPEGVTELAVDSVFMMPHLGVLSTVNPRAAAEVFHADCLVRLGTCVAPRGKGLKAVIREPGKTREVEVPFGEIAVFPFDQARVELVPERGMDIGAGPGRAVVKEITQGLIVDCRGRPLKPDAEKLEAWSRATGEY